MQAKLAAVVGDSVASLREYVMKHYLVLYLQLDDTLILLSIKHHKQSPSTLRGTGEEAREPRQKRQRDASINAAKCRP